ncbi:hypothetical protein NM208_g9815 [Fusarium decemcellulare]|uniref:Uncharacterized protein n=1 Tax=Fusarium decemcellulare TaxID=57161 RepID=A0ACC1S0D9_9HYPO|nr:hypothetical protein NM208_g9815 [Fusarium decemcellulare]
MRYDLEQSLSRLPTYEDDQEDIDDKRALGKGHTVYATAEDLDEEDEELDEFNELEIGERLGKVLEYLRENHQYCFWCKMAYPDKEMEGCPGKLRPCPKADEVGTFAGCDRGLVEVEIKGPINLLCQPCLVKYDGVNCSNKNQKIFKVVVE